MNGEKASRKDKNQNIQVFVRLRPINNRERDLKSQGVVEVSGNKEVIVKSSPLETKLTKKFTFDRAFGPLSKQVDVYHEVVSPLIEEVLSGYNCTVFAYGQTGTGKTHTMVGESSVDGEVPWQNDPMAGIIPRSLSQLFDELRITNAEYTVRVSYLELYNEELFDLLSSTEDNSKLRIYEDVTRKGSNIVNGLEEVTVYNKNEVYKIMAKGQEKRRIASTLMNAQSSRSHTVFTIVVHMKENSSEGEELMKIGKLNLVDLAGSENISKAGSDNPARKERARECVNINQSLLTLGRVITSLVERHPHIPYRESKLTRLLQESLGGRTKTSIIATISPGHRDVEETLSTLEYANRARCIQNKPEVNQRITKHAVLKEYSEEIDRLKRDLLASREKNGVYISMDSYSDMNMKMEEQSKELQEQILYIRAVKEEKDRIEGLFTELADNLKKREEQLARTNTVLVNTKNVLKDTKKELVQTNREVGEQKHLVIKHVETETKLSSQAKTLLTVAVASTTDVSHLHNTMDKKRVLEDTNLKKVRGFGEKSSSHREQMKTYLNNVTDSQIHDLQVLQNVIDNQQSEHQSRQNETKTLLTALYQDINQMLATSEAIRDTCHSTLACHTGDSLSQLQTGARNARDSGHQKLQGLMENLVRLEEERNKEREAFQQMSQFVHQWKDAFVAKLVNLRHVQGEWWSQTTLHLQNVERQYRMQQEAAISEGRRAALARRMQAEELRKQMQQLEAKIFAEMSSDSTEEEARLVSMERDTESLGGALSKGSARLAGTAEGVGRAVGLLEESNKGFIADISTMHADHKTRVEAHAKIEEEIKESVFKLSDYWREAWDSNVTKTEEIKQDIQKKQTEAIANQHDCYADFLKKCQSEAPNTLTPVETTIAALTQQSETNRVAFEALQLSQETFRKEMGVNLNTNDTIESQFVNEDYRLYSPTGKTPNRRDFSYPRELAATSPHETIIRRFRNALNGIHSPQSAVIINLDQTIEETPVKAGPLDSSSSSDSGTASPPGLGDSSSLGGSQQFAAPRVPAPQGNKLSPNQMHKCTSEGDIYSLVHTESVSKENLNRTADDKKEFKSRLKQPASQKKILGNRNY